ATDIPDSCQAPSIEWHFLLTNSRRYRTAVEVSAVKKAICFCLLAWMFLQSSSQAQTGPDVSSFIERTARDENVKHSSPVQSKIISSYHRTNPRVIDCGRVLSLEQNVQQ